MIRTSPTLLREREREQSAWTFDQLLAAVWICCYGNSWFCCRVVCLWSREVSLSLSASLKTNTHTHTQDPELFSLFACSHAFSAVRVLSRPSWWRVFGRAKRNTRSQVGLTDAADWMIKFVAWIFAQQVCFLLIDWCFSSYIAVSYYISYKCCLLNCICFIMLIYDDFCVIDWESVVSFSPKAKGELWWRHKTWLDLVLIITKAN